MVAPDRHTALLTIMLAGVATAASEGIADGLAFFMQDMRRALAIAFVALLVGGVGLQAYAHRAFIISASNAPKRN